MKNHIYGLALSLARTIAIILALFIVLQVVLALVPSQQNPQKEGVPPDYATPRAYHSPRENTVRTALQGRVRPVLVRVSRYNVVVCGVSAQEPNAEINQLCKINLIYLDISPLKLPDRIIAECI